MDDTGYVLCLVVLSGVYESAFDTLCEGDNEEAFSAVGLRGDFHIYQQKHGNMRMRTRDRREFGKGGICI